jgi:hypothetical protein
VGDVDDSQPDVESVIGERVDDNVKKRSQMGKTLADDEEQKEKDENRFGKLDKKVLTGSGKKSVPRKQESKSHSNIDSVEPEPREKPKTLLGAPRRRKPQANLEDDVEMVEVEEEITRRGEDQRESPATPVRIPPKALPDTKAAPNSGDVIPLPVSPNKNTPTFRFVPPLSKEPFLNIESLSKAEMDMTVEEWIRYQMGMEYEKFMKDGERELASFKGKAEEVRRAIQAL